MTIKFREFTAADEKGNSRPILSVSQDVVGLLESITAPEKAQSVPYLKIWQVDPHTGRPVNEKDGRPIHPLSTQLAIPPRFGMSVADGDNRFRERPAVSLERVSIKTESPKGIILYRTLEISFVIHRPDVVFGAAPEGEDSWSSMLTPGTVHAMEYGWVASNGVKNDLLNGNGYVDRSSHPPIIVPAVNRIRFIVTNYSLKILPDNQFSIVATAVEDGEFNVKWGLLDEMPRSQQPEAESVPVGKPPQDIYGDDGQQMMEGLKEKFKQTMSRAKKGKNGNVISLKELADSLFAPAIERAYRSLGYDGMEACFGLFNERAGTTSSKYGALDLTGRSIGSFEFPVSEVERVFGGLLKAGSQVTLYNFMLPFVRLVRNPGCWDRTFTPRDSKGTQVAAVPEIVMRTVFNRSRDGKTSAVFYIIDAKREYTKFAASEADSKLDPRASRSQIREKLKEKGVPMISFMRGNSYIQDATFDVIADEAIKAIFMRRYLRPTRSDIQGVSKKRKVAYVDPRQLLYSSAIQGEISMIGNFAFDMFGLVWLDFGVHQWSGPFLVKNRDDIIDRTGFTTKVSLISEGDDPLGTQGRVDLRKDI